MSRPAASAILAAGAGAHRSDVVGPTQPGIGVSSERPSPLGGDGREAFIGPLPAVEIRAPANDDGLPILLKYQADWVDDPADVKVGEKSRRIGLTWAEAFDDVTIAAASRVAGGMPVFYIGYNFDMAREFIAACSMWAQHVRAAVADSGETIFRDVAEDGTVRDIKAFRIDFASGYSITALPSRPRSLRGMQGVVVLDEGAFHDDLAGMMKAALALLMWGGKVRIISTHFGSGNYFNELVGDARSKRKPYSHHRITLDDALKDGLYRRICTQLGKTWSAEAEKEWREKLIAQYSPNHDEELFCIPSEGSGAYIPFDLIQRAANKNLGVVRWGQTKDFTFWPDDKRQAAAKLFAAVELAVIVSGFPKEHAAWIGVDFARKGDLTAIWVGWTLPSGKRVTGLVLELRDVPFTEQEWLLGWIVEHLPRFRAMKLDATGNGAFLAERMQQRFGAGRVEAVHLSRDWYINHFPQLKAAFEDTAFSIPNDHDIFTDLRMVTMADGCPRVPESKRTQGGDGGQRHGDAAVAAVLAYAASRAAPFAVDYTALSGSARDKLEPKAEADARRLRMRPGNDDDKPRRARGY